MPWTTDAQIKGAVSSIMKLASGSTALPSHWTDIMVAANKAAYNWIRSVLAGKGFTPAQMDQWDSREDYNRRLALCKVFQEVTLSEGQTVSVESFCNAKQELLDKEFVFTVDGVVVDPTTGSGSPRISTGTFNARSSTDTSVGLDTEF